jgi:hypothetical protein
MDSHVSAIFTGMPPANVGNKFGFVDSFELVRALWNTLSHSLCLAILAESFQARKVLLENYAGR